MMHDIPAAISKTDFAIIACSVDVNCSIDDAWLEVGSFANAGRFLNVSSKLISGMGQLGSVRLVNETILEVMVGSSCHSYTYAQVSGPMAAFSYHGCLGLSLLSSGSCRLTYSLIYDQISMEKDRSVSEFERVSGRFQAAAQAMKLAAETSSR